MRRVFPEESGRVDYCGSASEVAEGAHAILLVTECDEFGSPDWAKLREAMEVPVVVDGRNFLDAASLREAGFEYFSVGRGEATVSARSDGLELLRNASLL